jgi:hypothetical protein
VKVVRRLDVTENTNLIVVRNRPLSSIEKHTLGSGGLLSSCCASSWLSLYSLRTTSLEEFTQHRAETHPLRPCAFLRILFIKTKDDLSLGFARMQS